MNQVRLSFLPLGFFPNPSLAYGGMIVGLLVEYLFCAHGVAQEIENQLSFVSKLLVCFIYLCLLGYHIKIVTDRKRQHLLVLKLSENVMKIDLDLRMQRMTKL